MRIACVRLVCAEAQNGASLTTLLPLHKMLSFLKMVAVVAMPLDLFEVRRLHMDHP